MRTAISMTFAAAAASCATTPNVAPVNAPMTAASVESTELGAGEDALVLALSGGGARASAFSYGVLLELRDTPTADGGRAIDDVALVTAVSGGAVTAGYFGQHGADGLDGFRAAALEKDWAGELRTSPLAPSNWLNAYGGGVNGRDRLAEWLDNEVYGGGTLSDFSARPRIVLNATELYTGAPFAFAAPYFQAICSDLGAVRIADAVAASMSVPLAFRPVVVESFAEDCPAPLPDWVNAAAHDRGAPVLLRETARAFTLYRDPARMRYLHLSDGGIVDNFGLSSLITMRRASETPYGPFAPADAVRARRVTFLVVDAGQSPSGDWPLEARGPNGPEVIESAIGDSINANKRIAYDAFAALLADWRGDLITYRCGLSAEEAQALGAADGWACEDLTFTLDMISFADLDPADYARLSTAPTRVSLPADLVDALIEGGREATRRNAALRAR